MPDICTPETDPGDPQSHHISIKGHPGPDWSDWFAALTLTLDDNGFALLTGPVDDQFALYGVLEISAGRRTAFGLDQSCSTRSGRGKSPSNRKTARSKQPWRNT
jgi:hypothetical protein